jgi:arylsulfatase A-like enzyme
MFRFLSLAAVFLGLGSIQVQAAERNVVMILIDGLPAYLLGDPQASLPVIRELAGEGVAAATGMHVSDPSITWPNQTSLVTGSHADRHGVVFNGGLERRGPGELVKYFASRTQQELVRIPLLFDVLKRAGQNSAAINWPCTRGSTSIDDNFPDVPGALAYTTPRLKDELARKGLLARFEGGNDVVQDEIRTEVACQVIRDRMPRFLALHLNNVDAAHHRQGRVRVQSGGDRTRPRRRQPEPDSRRTRLSLDRPQDERPLRSFRRGYQGQQDFGNRRECRCRPDHRTTPRRYT